MLVVALRDIVSNIPSVESRAKGERFQVADWLAQELEEAGEVEILGGTPRPKEDRALSAGPQAQSRSSSPVARASRKRR